MSKLFRSLASLKLTVVLLALSIFLVLAGTLAQRFDGIWTVMENYFRCFVAWIELRNFFPRDWNVGGAVPFPGGWAIGGALLVNLTLAHAIRFKVKAGGARLLGGLAVVAVGSAATWYVIADVFNHDSSQETQDPTLRVALQLLRGGGAAAILLLGCWMLFKKKAGIVLLHAGIILMMVSELITGTSAEEGHMTILEGSWSNFVEDSREVELAVVDGSEPTLDVVVAIPEARLRRGGTISHPALPFELVTDSTFFMANSSLAPAGGGPNTATAGDGLEWIATREDPVSGTDTEGRVDVPSMYVTAREPGGATIGTYLVSNAFTRAGLPQTVTAGGRTVSMWLRPRRTYKPYTLHLKDFRFDKYVGTMTAKNFSSKIRLVDPEHNVDREVLVWMNNPLRYRGETLYQAKFTPDEGGTVLQVVENRGWMVPYVGCMIVAVGMLAQFGLTLAGFLRKERP